MRTKRALNAGRRARHDVIANALELLSSGLAEEDVFLAHRPRGGGVREETVVDQLQEAVQNHLQLETN